jgi:hypothetical protein
MEQLQPDIVLVEGPPEGERLLPWVLHAQMKPPVAMLMYVPQDTRHAVFYPFTVFSPEWQAMHYALQKNIPVRFIDLPLAYKFGRALQPEEERIVVSEGKNTSARCGHQHPLDYLASLDGFDDEDEWWEQLVERRHGALEAFEAIAEAMAALRADEAEDEEDLLREAFMRKAIRKAEDEDYQCIVVVCGAWHVPALQNRPPAKSDEALMKKLPKAAVEATWIPWTNERLGLESGYGAGIKSPGWYEHVWNHNDREGIHWLVKTAQIFRTHRMDVSTAHVQETVRLSSALASLRGLSQPGLKEFKEAIQSVMCMGEALPLQLIERDLWVGNQLGEIPEGAPQTPLQRDFEACQKKLRLKPKQEPHTLVLDLREAYDLQKSVFLHRLQVLGLDWATLSDLEGKGTFKEAWNLEWNPEMMIRLVENAIWGNTVEEAAAAFLKHQVIKGPSLPQLTNLLLACLPAELPEAFVIASEQLEKAAAGSRDVQDLLRAFIPLIQVRRYGDVRKTDTQLVSVIMDGLFTRSCIGLPSAAASLDEDAAQQLCELMRQTDQGLQILQQENYWSSWHSTLLVLCDDIQVQPLLSGLATKLLMDAHQLENGKLEQYFLRALSSSVEPMRAAWWLESFLKGSSATLLYEESLWLLVHSWMNRLSWEQFQSIVPLLRRTFAGFSVAERRMLARKAQLGAGGGTNTLPRAEYSIQEERAICLLPVLSQILLPITS